MLDSPSDFYLIQSDRIYKTPVDSNFWSFGVMFMEKLQPQNMDGGSKGEEMICDLSLLVTHSPPFFRRRSSASSIILAVLHQFLAIHGHKPQLKRIPTSLAKNEASSVSIRGVLNACLSSLGSKTLLCTMVEHDWMGSPVRMRSGLGMIVVATMLVLGNLCRMSMLISCCFPAF